MEIPSLIIAAIALVIAVAAFMRTGGVRELKRQAQALSSSTDSVRDRAADALNRLDQLVRGKERPRPGESMPTRTPAEGESAGVAARTPRGRSRRG